MFRQSVNSDMLSPVSFLARSARVYPNKVAVVYGTLRYTYREFQERIHQLAPWQPSWIELREWDDQGGGFGPSLASSLFVLKVRNEFVNGLGNGVTFSGRYRVKGLLVDMDLFGKKINWHCCSIALS